MKYAAPQLIAFAGLSTAFPHPQFSSPFTMPSFPRPSFPSGGFGGAGGAGGLPSFPSPGGAGGIPSVPSFPSAGGAGGIPSFPSAGGAGGIPSFPSAGGAGGIPSIPSFPSTGGAGGIPSFPSAGGAGGIPSIPSFPGAGGASPTSVQITPTAPAAGGNSAGTVGSNCTPQGASGGSTENGVAAGNCCTDMTVIFARGTGEMGNVGSVSGPPMFRALRAKIPNRVTIQGVDYPADAGGNSAQGGIGGQVMADLVRKALTQCPRTKIILSGYSQGAMVVHSAFNKGVSASQVAGAVLFGDPMKRSKLPISNVQQFCGTSDFVCGGGGDGGATGSHVSYGSNADAAAAFAIKAAGL